MRNRKTTTCPITGKTRFKDQARAQRRLEQIADHPSSGPKPVRAYPCRGCSGWHLSSQPTLRPTPATA